MQPSLNRPSRSIKFSDPDPLLTPHEVAAIFRVKPKTVTRWANAGKLACTRTLGGHRRYRQSDVRALLTYEPPVTTQN